MKMVPNAVLLGSLPESNRETVDQQGAKALEALEHYFARVQAIWKPVATEEAFEIVRRRLFAQIKDRAAADATCRAFADHYVTHAADLPGETQEGNYLRRMQAAYPIHPEVFERLYTDWSTLPNFQRTRGVLKLMAKVIHRLWQDGNQDYLLMPGSLPLYDGSVRTELTNYLPPGWDPVLEHDVDGERAEPTDLDQREPRFGAVQASRRVTRCIFLGSAPTSSNSVAKGLETERVVLGSLQPGQAPHLYRDALGRLETRLTFLFGRTCGARWKSGSAGSPRAMWWKASVRPCNVSWGQVPSTQFTTSHQARIFPTIGHCGWPYCLPTQRGLDLDPIPPVMQRPRCSGRAAISHASGRTGCCSLPPTQTR